MIATHITEEKSTYISSDEETKSLNHPNIFPSTHKMNQFTLPPIQDPLKTDSLISLMCQIKNDQKLQASQKSLIKQNLKQQVLKLMKKN
jgi:hypothetical protein